MAATHHSATRFQTHANALDRVKKQRHVLDLQKAPAKLTAAAENAYQLISFLAKALLLAIAIKMVVLRAHSVHNLAFRRIRSSTRAVLVIV